MRVFVTKLSFFRAALTLMFLVIAPVGSSAENKSYNALSESWIQEVLSKDPVKDPRSDYAQLRPVLNYDSEIIQVHSFEKAQRSSLVGEGWQLVGAVVDLIIHGDSKYVLYGRRNLYFRAGLWNNILDKDRSFEEYLVVKITGDQTELIIHKRLIATTAQILIGLRLASDNGGFELLQNTQSGIPQSIWTYRF